MYVTTLIFVTESAKFTGIVYGQALQAIMIKINQP